jgi:A/G-specific adenine glycosylase
VTISEDKCSKDAREMRQGNGKFQLEAGIHSMRPSDVEALRCWFGSHSRALPWRTHADPYAIWISEVMLQQTQAAVVIPYYERWLQRFPTIASLAAASLDEVLKEWEGLGYYSRARHLHAGARYVVEQFGGQLPCSAELLKQIKGLGPYTVGAIMNFAFHQRHPAVDGNVLRVISRYYGLLEDISQPKTVKQVERKVAELLPEQEPWIITEALIELGATICMKKAACHECPIREGCQAYAQGMTSQLPIKAARKPVTQLHRAVAVIAHNDHFLVQRGAKGQVMADLWEFPYFELEQPGSCDKWLARKIAQELQLKVVWRSALSPVSHAFTRYRARLYPHLFHAQKVNKAQKEGEGEWLSLAQLKQQPFSSGHRRILNELVLTFSMPGL